MTMPRSHHQMPWRTGNRTPLEVLLRHVFEPVLIVTTLMTMAALSVGVALAVAPTDTLGTTTGLRQQSAFAPHVVHPR